MEGTGRREGRVAAGSAGLDPMYMACSLFRRRRLEECVEVCTKLLEKNPFDQGAWFLKLRALTEQTYVDEVEYEEEGLAESLLDENAIASLPRPGTSLRVATRGSGTSQGVRPLSQSGRPLSGFLRPGTVIGRPGTVEQALRTPRTAQTARPVTSASGRHVRMGTASMLTEPNGPFIDVAKLNLARYASRPALALALFEYLFHHENDVRSALDLAAAATEASQFQSWWWKMQVGKCYYRLGMYREAERQFLSAQKNFEVLDLILYLGKVYSKLDQPLAAVEVYKKGLATFPKNSSLLIAVARVYDALGEADKAVAQYREVLAVDSTCVEAMACLGMHHFYNDQPEIALRYYRRLLQMGVHNTEIFLNVGLCCFYSQQYDIALNCLLRALSLASNEHLADVWYNIGLVALGVGDSNMAYQSFKLALVHDNNHAEALNNLGVLEWKRGRGEVAQSCFQSSGSAGPHLYEPFYNMAFTCEKIGDIQQSYQSCQQSLKVFPSHVDSQELIRQLKQHFAAL